MFAVYKRETKAYFTGMTGVIFISLVLAITGIFTTVINIKSLSPKFELSLSDSMLIFLLAMPILTMRSFAEERHNQTDRLLLSLPLGSTRIVAAKYFSMVTVFGCSVLVMCLYPLIFDIYADVNLAASYGAILAFFLLGCSLIAVGMYISTFTESQVIAAVVTFGTFLVIYLLPLIAELIPTSPAASLAGVIVAAVLLGVLLWFTLKNYYAAMGIPFVGAAAALVVYLVNSELFDSFIPDLLKNLSLFDRVYAFTNYGIFDLTGVVYFITASALFVYLTVRALEKRRWS